MRRKHPRNQHVDFEIPVAVSVATPAVRLLALEASASHDDGREWTTEVVTRAVVGIETSVVHCYARTVPWGDAPPPTAPSHAELVRNGWVYQGADQRRGVLVVDAELGLVSTAALAEPVNVIVELVAAPWPEAEDDDRLAGIRRRLADEAIAKARHAEQPDEARPAFSLAAIHAASPS